MTPDRSFQQLVQQYLDGTATPDGMQRLNQQLRTVPEARQWFIELLNVDSALAAALIDEPTAPRNRSCAVSRPPAVRPS